jgi:hypothetical protein
MNRRLLTSLVVLLYVSVAVVLGVIHHHEHADGGHGDCTACVWQINGTTDAPSGATMPADSVLVVATVPAYAPVTPVAPFLPSTASRAPPETSV